MKGPHRFDAIVVGAGPAGVVAASRMAGAGLSVAIVDPAFRRVKSGRSRPGSAPGDAAPGDQRPGSRIEGLGARTLACLDTAGFADCARLAALLPGPLPRESFWAGEHRPGLAEFLVDRLRLSEALRMALQASGDACTIPASAVLERPRLSRRNYRVRLSTGEVLEAPVVCLASGRRALRGGDRDHRLQAATLRGPATLILAAALPCASPLTSTRVNALEDGWSWAVPVAPDHAAKVLHGRRGARPHRHTVWVQLAVDPQTVCPPDARRLPASRGVQGALAPQERLYSAACQAGLAPLERPQVAQIFACSGSMLLRDWTSPCGVFAIGDAAAAIDPLSGHGLLWALAGALGADAVARTIIEDPPGIAAELTRAFKEQRAHQHFWRQATTGQQLYAEQCALTPTPFWRRRAAWSDNQVSSIDSGEVHRGFSDTGHDAGLADVTAHDGAMSAFRPRRVVARDGKLVEVSVADSGKPAEYGPRSGTGSHVRTDHGSRR